MTAYRYRVSHFSRVLTDPEFREIDFVTIPLSGRSGSEHNAQLLIEMLPALLEKPLAQGSHEAPTHTVIIAYSKGVADTLLALSNAPQLGESIDAFVGVAGAVGVVDSLRTDTRQATLTASPAPDSIPYYSVVAITSDETISRGLTTAWQHLLRYDARSDGQVLAVDALIPNSRLLAYTHADHWGVIIEPELDYPRLVARASPKLFPQDILLKAILGQVLTDLDRDQNVESDAAAWAARPSQ